MYLGCVTCSGYGSDSCKDGTVSSKMTRPQLGSLARRLWRAWLMGESGVGTFGHGAGASRSRRATRWVRVRRSRLAVTATIRGIRGVVSGCSSAQWVAVARTRMSQMAAAAQAALTAREGGERAREDPPRPIPIFSVSR